MADGFFAAIDTASRAAFARTPAAGGTAVTWTHATTGIVVLMLLQAAILIGPFIGTLPEGLRALIDFAAIALIMLVVPFLVLYGAAQLTKKAEQLPAIFLFLALILAVSQVVALVLGAFGISSSTALVGILAYFTARVAKSLLGIGWGGAILVGFLAAAGTIGAGFLLLALPTGQAMLAAA